MILIVVKYAVRPERSGEWLELVQEFTQAVRDEPGNLFFEWSTSADVPHQFVLVEGFESAEAGAEHVNSEHFKAAMAWMPKVIASKPDIIHVEAPDQTGWSEMAELTPEP